MSIGIIREYKDASNTEGKIVPVFFSLRSVSGDQKMTSELRSTLLLCGSLLHINLAIPSELNDNSISAKLQISWLVVDSETQQGQPTSLLS